MHRFAEELRRARVAHNISLGDIAASKLININYLGEMEKGNFSFLPQTYMRAFVREYATCVGLDPSEVLRKYDDAWAREQRRHESQANPAPAVTAKPKTPISPILLSPLRDLSSAVRPWLNPLRIRIGLSLLLIVALSTVLWNALRSNAPDAVDEIPFSVVIKENERRLMPAGDPVNTIDAPTGPGDSLHLIAYTRDTVWMQITIDNLAPEDYIFYPHGRMSWRATRRFLVTLGNAGGVELTLNKKNLGTVGNRGTVVRNLELNRQTLLEP
jgi:hypothetical protein